ncbi:MAG: hypothetical protein LBQ66_05855 [Planctomycetaceae bacterium]|jgi:nitrogenase molybdenum-iron protein alpha chain|nr:hypothetical protein [Planctomycetaceae bacterium]
MSTETLKPKINLQVADCETREQRLGTIIGWSGKASELSALSNKARCGGGGRRECALCEIKSPFTQGSVCCEQMVECQAGNVRNAVLVQHSPIGCAAGQPMYNSIYRNGLAMRGLPVENILITCTNLNESDMIFGAIYKLHQTIQDVYERYKPEAIFVSTSCSTAIIADDIEGASAEAQEKLGIPVIPLYCEGFRSKHWSTGFDATQHGILRQIVRKNPTRKQDDLINVINLWGSDVFSPILAELGLRVNYVVDMATVEQLAQLSEAAATVGFCYTLSSYLAAALEQEFGVPEIKAPQPYGFAGTDEWLREIGRVTHREDKVEAYIKKERAAVAPRLKELRKKLRGVRGYTATGSAYSHGLISVMRELGVSVNGSLVFHHDPVYDSGDEREDSLKYLVENYGDVPQFHVSNRQQHLFYGILKKTKPDFILIRHNGLAPLASRLGIPAAPLGDEHIAIGYRGIINLGEVILEVLAHKKFHEDLAEHVTLPYSNWWLEQDDPYILAKHPELIERQAKV